MNDDVLNGTVVMILFTCIISSVATERAARRMVTQENLTGNDDKNNKEQERILMTHVDAELFKVRALDGRELLIPEALALFHGRGIVRDALVDLFNVPAFRQDLAEIGALQGVEHIHSSSSFCPAGAGDFFPCASIISPARGRCQ